MFPPCGDKNDESGNEGGDDPQHDEVVDPRSNGGRAWEESSEGDGGEEHGAHPAEGGHFDFSAFAENGDRDREDEDGNDDHQGKQDDTECDGRW